MEISKLKESIKSLETKDKFDEAGMIMAHHSFIRWYGWIGLEEFKQLPLITFFNLLNCQKEENEKNKPKTQWLNKK